MAVNAVHTTTGFIGGALSTRMTSNGGHISTTVQEFIAQDQHGAQDLKGVHQESAAASILGAMAGGPPSGEAGSSGSGTGLPGSLLPDKTDWILGGAGSAGQTITDKVAALTREGLASGGAQGASSTVAKAVEEIRNPLTVLGEEAPTLGSKMGGGVGAVLSIPAIARDVGEGKMSAGQAIAREGVGLVAGTLAAGPATALAGPVGGIVAGISVGNLAAKGVDVVWEPLQEFGEAAAGGGYKVARLGRL